MNDLPEHLRDPMKVLERGRQLEESGGVKLSSKEKVISVAELREARHFQNDPPYLVQISRLAAEQIERLETALREVVNERDAARILLDEARAAHESQPAASKECYWLLETDWGPYIHYFGPQGGVRSRGGGHIGTEPHEFTRDANRATLFRTKEDAEQFHQWMQANIRHSWLGWKVTEHEWVPPRAALEPLIGPAAEQSAANSGQCVSREAAQSGTTAGSSLPPPGALTDQEWHAVYMASETPTVDVTARKLLRELLGRRRTQPTPAVPSKFDLAFEVMRLMDHEESESLQSCHFGYVLRVEREKHSLPPAVILTDQERHALVIGAQEARDPTACKLLLELLDRSRPTKSEGQS